MPIISVRNNENKKCNETQKQNKTKTETKIKQKTPKKTQNNKDRKEQGSTESIVKWFWGAFKFSNF